MELDSDIGFRLCESFFQGIRRIAHQQINASHSYLPDLGEVGRLIDGWGEIEFEVSCIDEPCVRGLHIDSAGIRDVMVLTEELDLEDSDIENPIRIRIRDDQLRFIKDSCLLQLLAYESHRELRRVDGRESDGRKDMLQAPDMIQVSVSDDDSADLVLQGDEEGNVREAVFRSEHGGFRELDPSVDDEDLSTVLDDAEVLPDLIMPSYGDDPRMAVLKRREGLRFQIREDVRDIDRA